MDKVNIAGQQVFPIGLGTLNMGDNPGKRAQEINAIQTGLDHGVQVIDTAGMSFSLNKSLNWLGLDELDLYLLHWHINVPLEEIVEALEKASQIQLTEQDLVEIDKIYLKPVSKTPLALW